MFQVLFMPKNFYSTLWIIINYYYYNNNNYYYEIFQQYDWRRKDVCVFVKKWVKILLVSSGIPFKYKCIFYTGRR